MPNPSAVLYRYGKAFDLLTDIPSTGSATSVYDLSLTGTINYDVITQNILIYTGDALDDWILNIRGNNSVALNDLMSINQSIDIALFATIGNIFYYQNSLTVDGSQINVQWPNSIQPTTGNLDCIDVYQIKILKTGDATFVVSASMSEAAFQ